MNSLLDLKPTETVLFLAEGNFTFSSSLVQYWIKGCPFKLSKIVSTSYEPEPVSKIAEDNVENLKKFGVQVLFSVDARKCDDVIQRLKRLDSDYENGFTKIIFMFPHVGGKSKIHLNRDLLKNFAMSVRHHLRSSESKVFVTLCGGQGGTSFDSVKRVSGDTWQIVQMMAFGEFEMVDVDRFNLKVFPDYQSFGYRGLNKGFHSENGMVHVFEPAFHGSDFSTYDNCISIEELQQKYVEEKLDLFFKEKVSVQKVLIELVEEVGLIERKLIDRDNAIVLNGTFETVDQIKLPQSPESFVRLIILVNFSLNLVKCPVNICLLIATDESFEQNDIIFGASRQNDGWSKIAKQMKQVSLSEGHTGLLVDVSGLVAAENPHQSWQKIWAQKSSLDPPVYSHDLAFTFNRDLDRKSINDAEMSAVLFSVGFDSVIDFKLFDVYVDNNSLTSNTVRIVYQSHLFPMSKDKVWMIHYEKIGRTLEKMFKVTLR